MRHPDASDYEVFIADDGQPGVRPSASRTWVWSPAESEYGWMVAEPGDPIPMEPGWWTMDDEKPGNEPCIVIWPARLSGQPTIGNTRISAEDIAWHACNEPGGVASTISGWDLTRAQVLTACWWVGTHRNRTILGKHLAEWAEAAFGPLARCEYGNIPDPPPQGEDL